MLTFAVGELPNSWQSVVLLPIFFALLGAGVWIAGRMAELKHGAKPWKWAACVPMALALTSGWSPFAKMRDFIYSLAIEPFGSKMRIAHYVAFLFPIVCVAALVGWEYWDRRQNNAESK